MGSSRKPDGKRRKITWPPQLTFARGAAIAVLAGLCVGAWLRAWLM